MVRLALVCAQALLIRGLNNSAINGSTPAVTPADGRYPNYMIPVWKQRMFDRANNLTEAGISEFLESASAGHKYKLVAYQGCRIIGILSNLEREKCEE